ncbi:MAG: ribonuclease HI family protein [Endomicrobia bacterium]|nr:ribonuclease HI family protein [Endomicrobiia bacterium]
MNKFKLYFDGNKTPEGVSCSYSLTTYEDKVIFEETLELPQNTTVPEAEYFGVIKGIEKALQYFKKNNFDLKEVTLDIYGDSQLVIKQLTGEYECKKTQLRILRSKVKNLLAENSLSYSFNWVPREKNIVK